MRKIKLGIFGLSRGTESLEVIQYCGADIVAICDKREEALKKTSEALKNTPTCYTDFDKFIEHEGLEAVLLANYFHEHAPYAIRCLEKGIHVLSECASNGTMAEGVALVRAAEKSNAIYMLAEN